MDVDIVVVGGGHAGAEAAAAAARLGRRVALVTLSMAQIGRLSCNPAIGGLAKGCLVRELDALGGLMARVADATTVQFRHLNTRKGLAVRASRAQVDTDRYPPALQAALAALPELELVEGEAAGLLLHEDRIAGLALTDGRRLLAPKVVLTTGTFLSGRMHRGSHTQAGGRIGEGASYALSTSLRGLGVALGRLKTGTPPRLARDSVDWSACEEQDALTGFHFSFQPPAVRLPQIPCHITYTTEATHALIREHLHTSAMFSGAIEGTGPRYCPSIEDKVVRFDRPRHQLFLEPEGLDSDRVYVNGLSTSLSAEVQDALLPTIPGLAHARIVQHGYAVEYDHVDPTRLGHDLQHAAVPGLYFAGQVNGTSGYEEAAAQGFVAGVSAALDRPFVLRRDQAYIGVLIDDLVTRGIGGEPYRMFSSRAEHRLALREDNADRRLAPTGRELGLVDDLAWSRFEHKMDQIDAARRALEHTLRPTDTTRRRLSEAGVGTMNKPLSAEELLRRPGVDYATLATVVDLPELDPEAAEQVETDVKYAGYLEREAHRARRTAALHAAALIDVDFGQVPGLSTEVRQRLQAHRPATLGSASRLPGITPAAITALSAWLARAHP